MYRSARYPTDPAAVEAFVASQRHGYLIATPPGGHPQVSLLPFVKQGDEIEVHCVQEDATFAAVQANPLVTFLVADFLAMTRHDWVDPRDAGRATLNFRAVAFACQATTSTDPAAVAATLARLVAAYEPDASYEPIVDGDFYGPRLRRLAVVRLRVLATDAKFKVGPAAPVAVKRRVVAELRARGEPGDARAADVIEASLPTEATEERPEMSSIRPEEPTPAGVAALLADLAAMPGRLSTRLGGLGTGNLRAEPAPGGWSARDVLAHLRASDDILTPRLYQILARDDPPLPAFDERRWAEVAGYVDGPLDLSLAGYSARRAELVRALRRLDLAAWRRTGRHEGQGRLTLWQVARHLAAHEAEHLAQLERLLASPR